MSGAGIVNLSLLSRGVGEVQKNGHEKVEVFLEPEDYYNFAADPNRKYYLPPLKPKYTESESPRFSSHRDIYEISLPKTFTTRKGALLLFSEDLALKNRERDEENRTGKSSSHLDAHKSVISLRTVDDLARSILSYGNEQEEETTSEVYLKFLHGHRRKRLERQIRPGFSAKRYLATWTKNWDDTMLDSIISKGYITERSLFHYNLVLPHRRRIFYEDLSHVPPPYKLMKTMLLSPGSLSGYTFQRILHDSSLVDIDEGDEQALVARSRSKTKPTIRVIQTRDGVQKEVNYSSLDKKAQEEVLTDLLVKSAVHYALQKQEEYEEMLSENLKKVEEQNVPGSITDTEQRLSPSNRASAFDMKEAVESLLDSQRSRGHVDADFPEADNKSVASSFGSFKGGVHHPHSRHPSQPAGKPWGHYVDEASREYIGNVPVATVRDGSSSSSRHSSIPQLPPIKQTLTPIQDISREPTAQLVLPPIDDGKVLPSVHVEPPTPQATSLALNSNVARTRTQATTTGEDNESAWHVPEVPEEDLLAQKSKSSRTSQEDKDVESEAPQRKKRSKKGSSGDESGVALGGQLESAGESSHDVSPSHSRAHRPGWKGSQQSLRSMGSRRGQGSEGSVKSHHKSQESLASQGSSGSQRRGRVFHWSPDSSGTKAASVMADSSIKGSVVFAPDGEIVNVGGSVGRYDVAQMHDVSHAPDADVKGHGESEDEQEEWQKHLPPHLKSDEFKRHPPVRRESQASAATTSDQGIIEALTEHAQRIAQSVLSNHNTGLDLEEDIREAIEEIAKAQRASSAAPTAAEYKDLIRQSLTNAVAKAAGLEPSALPADAEISPELLEALATQTLTPEDIEIVQDDSGKPVIRSRSQLNRAMGGVKEGHIFVDPSSAKANGKPKISIPSDRVSEIEGLDHDVISYGVPEHAESDKGKSKAGSSKAESIPDPQGQWGEKEGEEEAPSTARTQPSGAEDSVSADDFLEAVQKAEEGPVVLPESESPSKRTEDTASVKSGVTGVSQKTEDSKKSKKSKVEHKEEFVVGKVDQKGELEKLYGPVEPPRKPSAAKDKVEKSPPKSPSPVPPDEEDVSVAEPSGRVDHKDEIPSLYKSTGGSPPAPAPKPAAKGKPKGKKPKKEAAAKKEEPKGKKKGKGKKKEKKEEEPAPAPEEPPEAAPPPKPRTPTPPVKAPSPVEEDDRTITPAPTNTDDEEDFIIIRDRSPTPEPPPAPVPTSTLPNRPPTPPEREDSEDSEGDNALKAITNKEARAAKRAAAAAKRREEVERRRKEREEQVRKEKEELERQERLKQEMEETRRKKEEEWRLRKEAEKEAKEKAEQDAAERDRRQKAELEREKRAKEEYQRKLEEMKKKQLEEEQKRMELLLQKAQEEEERRREEAEMMSQMAEQERLEYEKQKKLEEEERKRKEEEERRRREEEAFRAMEEARRLAEEMARKQALLEARLKFNRTLQVESAGLTHSQDITPAFTFSYYELLQWLGLDIPEFELAKLQAEY